MKGQIPVAYIVALILGVAVVALLGYWFFVQGGRFGGTVSLETCNAKKMSYCSQWQVKGFPSKTDGVPHSYSWLKPSDCSINEDAFWGKAGDWNKCFAPGCREIGVEPPGIDECRELLGIT